MKCSGKQQVRCEWWAELSSEHRKAGWGKVRKALPKGLRVLHFYLESAGKRLGDLDLKKRDYIRLVTFFVPALLSPHCLLLQGRDHVSIVTTVSPGPSSVVLAVVDN